MNNELEKVIGDCWACDMPVDTCLATLKEYYPKEVAKFKAVADLQICIFEVYEREQQEFNRWARDSFRKARKERLAEFDLDEDYEDDEEYED